MKRISNHLIAALLVLFIYAIAHVCIVSYTPIVINMRASEWQINSDTILKEFSSPRGKTVRNIQRFEVSARITGEKVKECTFERVESYVSVNNIFEENVMFEFMHDASPASTRGQGFQGFGRWLWVSDQGLPNIVRATIFHSCPTYIPFLNDIIVQTNLEFTVKK